MSCNVSSVPPDLNLLNFDQLCFRQTLILVVVVVVVVAVAGKRHKLNFAFR